MERFLKLLQEAGSLRQGKGLRYPLQIRLRFQEAFPN